MAIGTLALASSSSVGLDPGSRHWLGLQVGHWTFPIICSESSIGVPGRTKCDHLFAVLSQCLTHPQWERGHGSWQPVAGISPLGWERVAGQASHAPETSFLVCYRV